MYILLQLNSPLGAGVGPNFNLTANVGVVVPSTATATQLLAGIIVQVLNTATTINIVPTTGDCPATITVDLPTPPTTTSTTTTTTVKPPCNCIIIQSADPNISVVTYQDCNGHPAATSVLPYQIKQICGINPATSSFLLTMNVGGPCSFISENYKCTECAAQEGCYTYTVVNISEDAPKIINYTYLDCTGNEVTVAIPGPVPGVDPYAVTICTCGPITHIPTDLSIELISDEQCLVCKCYQIYNPLPTVGEGSELSYSYLDCDGKGGGTNTIEPGEVQVQCALEGSITLDAGLILSPLTSNTCVIPGDTDITPTGVPCKINTTQYCHTVQFIGQATIQYYQYDATNTHYTLKTLTGISTTLYVCATINSIIKTSGPGNIIITASTTVCTTDWECTPCRCVTIFNSSSDTDISVDYVLCDDGPTFSNINAGSFIVYCGLPPVNYDTQLEVAIGEVCPGKEYDCRPIPTPTRCLKFTRTSNAGTPVINYYDINGVFQEITWTFGGIGSIYQICGSLPEASYASITVGDLCVDNGSCPCPCITFTLIDNSCDDPIYLHWKDCDNVSHTVEWTPALTESNVYQVCGFNPETDAPCVTVTSAGLCTNGICPTTTTTSTTTTTTAAPFYIYYTARPIDGCVAVGPTYIVRSLTLIFGNYICISGTVYQVFSTTTGPTYNLTYVDNGTNSGNSCSPYDFVC